MQSEQALNSRVFHSISWQINPTTTPSHQCTIMRIRLPMAF